MDDVKDSFLLALDALKEYLPDIVISGGWVPFVYHSYLATEKPARRPLRTADVDITVPPGLRAGERPALGQVLKKQRFEAKEIGLLLGKFGPKGPGETKYVASKQGVEIELTFMSPRFGKDDRAAMALPAGIVAVLVRYVEILLAAKMKVPVSDRTSKGRLIEVEAQVPTPAAYFYQKGLSFVGRRSRYKKGKDLYYLFDLLSNYPELRKRCEAEIPGLKERFPRKWYQRFIANLEGHFKTPDSEGPGLVEEQRPGGGPDPAFRREVCRTFEGFLARIR